MHPPKVVDPEQTRAALADAIEQLEGWISWKCPAKHRAEHEANVERLRTVLATGVETQPGAPGFDGADAWNAHASLAAPEQTAREALTKIAEMAESRHAFPEGARQFIARTARAALATLSPAPEASVVPSSMSEERATEIWNEAYRISQDSYRQGNRKHFSATFVYAVLTLSAPAAHPRPTEPARYTSHDLARDIIMGDEDK